MGNYRAFGKSTLMMLGLIPLAAEAQGNIPELRPAQDVTIVSEVRSVQPAGTRVQRMTTYIQAGTRVTRTEQQADGKTLVFIFDPRIRRSWNMIMANGRIEEADVSDDDGEDDPHVLSRNPLYEAVRGAGAQVAGLSCTLWTIRKRGAPPAEADEHCVTNDGLVLRSNLRSEGRQSRDEASRVSYGALDPRLFVPPADAQPLPRSR